MNVFTHESYLKDRLRKARRLQYAGVVFVFLSFLLSLTGSFVGTPTSIIGPVLVFLAYPLLLVGLPMWSIARANQRRLQNAPLADQLLNTELKGLNSKYSLHHYATFEDQLIEHLLVTPAGLIVMQSSDVLGPVRCSGGPKGDRWRAPSSLFDRFTGQRPPIGNPTIELEGALSASRQLLQAAGKPHVPIKGILVFTRNPEIEVEGCSVPAVPLNEVKQTVRDLQYDMGGEREDRLNLEAILTSDDRKRVNGALSPKLAASPVKPASARR